MILYSDHIIKLDYKPAHDILTASLQVLRDYDAAEIRNAFLSIVVTVKEYNVTRLLLDFTRNTLDLTETEYKHSIAQLTVGLMQTPLEKIARIGTTHHVREQKISGLYEGIKNAVTLPIAFHIFSDKSTALDWLLKQE
ncbi:hypothetical protein H8S95_06310 [Pontibacter sp. KCTC 32443]|uniref:hypothetical protein n=1 Tax=Pontibacter TaxID=323449 RepID=UPI00164D4835|nr:MULTISPECIES: hypothetical protein [Pontibacter]MBC5773668.1 hypothetical protein [Pontibacter sp. KCTC 32443]